MYNRYIPQPDGSYRRSRQTDTPSSVPQQPRWENPRQEPPSREPSAECRPQPEFREEPPCPKGQPHNRRQSRPAPPPRPRPSQEPRDCPGAGSFLQQLLPKDFCTEDLLIVLLLLLMSGGDEDNQNIALLTLGLYLFL